MIGRDTGWEKWLFGLAYPLIALTVVHVGNDNSLTFLIHNPSYYSDIFLSLVLTYSVGFYFRWYYRKYGRFLLPEYSSRDSIGKYLLSAMVIPVSILVVLEAIYVALILGIPLGEVTILTLELPLIFLFCLLINAGYLIMGLRQEVTTGRKAKLGETSLFKDHFIAHGGANSRSIPTDDIAYFRVDEKVTFLIEQDGRKSIINQPLRELEAIVDPENFFLLNRQVLAHRRAVRAYERTDTRKLLVHLEPTSDVEQYVSKLKATAFVKWLAGDSVLSA